jgi:hypothetical protein
MGQLETDAKIAARRRQLVAAAAKRSVHALVKEHQRAGHTIRVAGLVVGSMTDPERITNPHIRAHALEGQLFRAVVAESLELCGVRSSAILERDVYARSAKVLGRTETELKRLLSQLGKSLSGPWRSDEKCAALAAWIALGTR